MSRTVLVPTLSFVQSTTMSTQEVNVQSVAASSVRNLEEFATVTDKQGEINTDDLSAIRDLVFGSVCRSIVRTNSRRRE